jgi:hypothetical protein
MRANWGRLLVALNVCAALAVLVVSIRFVAIPVVAKVVYAERYKELVFKCDDVMRTHFIAKTVLARRPSDEAIQQLRAAEVSLLACHDYDKLRKKLLALGVTEEELAGLGLDAIESRASDVRRFIEIHEIRY